MRRVEVGTALRVHMLLTEPCPSPHVTDVILNDRAGRLLIDDLAKQFSSVVGIAAVAGYVRGHAEDASLLGQQCRAGSSGQSDSLHAWQPYVNIPDPSTRRQQ